MPMFIDPRFKTIERQNAYLEHHHIFLQDGEDGKVNAELEVRTETLEPELLHYPFLSLLPNFCHSWN